MVRRKPTKTLRPKPAKRKVRIHTTPKLTRSEFEKLQATAAGEGRSVGNYVAFLLVQPLKGQGASEAAAFARDPLGRRSGCPRDRGSAHPGPEGRT